MAKRVRSPDTIGPENEGRMKRGCGVPPLCRARIGPWASGLGNGPSSLVAVQPGFHFGFQLLALVMGLLIELRAVPAVECDLIDRPEQNDDQKEQRKGPHDAHLMWWLNSGTVTSRGPFGFRARSALATSGWPAPGLVGFTCQTARACSASRPH